MADKIEIRPLAPVVVGCGQLSQDRTYELPKDEAMRLIKAKLAVAVGAGDATERAVIRPENVEVRTIEPSAE